VQAKDKRQWTPEPGESSLEDSLIFHRSSGQQSGGVFGVVGEDDARPRAPDALQRFHQDAIAFDLSILSGGFDHAVFTGDLIGG
jgi:hypothetical protein